MRIIALMNQKGGVGKTTTTVNLGAALAERGRKVCLIDLDPQAHLTINYGVEPSPEINSLYQMLVEEKSFLECVHKIDENIALVPSSIDLAAAEIELVSVLGRESLLKKRLEAAQHDFEYILLDCPPSLGLLTINALAIASEVIIPMQPHFLALQGVGKLLETVALVSKRMNPKLKVSGIVLTMFDAQTKLSNEVVNDLNGFIESAAGKNLPWAGARIFKSKIRRNIKLAESPSFGQTIIKYEPTSNGATDYRALADEVIAMTNSATVNQPTSVAQTAPTPAPEIKPKIAAPAPPPIVAPAPIQAPAPIAQKPAAAPAVSKPVPMPAPVASSPPPAKRIPIARPASPPALHTTVNVTIDQAKLTAASVPAPSTSDTPVAPRVQKKSEAAA
jgi:chromosome partitioning protein